MWQGGCRRLPRIRRLLRRSAAGGCGQAVSAALPLEQGMHIFLCQRFLFKLCQRSLSQGLLLLWLLIEGRQRASQQIRCLLDGRTGTWLQG